MVMGDHVDGRDMLLILILRKGCCLNGFCRADNGDLAMHLRVLAMICRTAAIGSLGIHSSRVARSPRVRRIGRVARLHRLLPRRPAAERIPARPTDSLRGTSRMWKGPCRRGAPSHHCVVRSLHPPRVARPSQPHVSVCVARSLRRSAGSLLGERLIRMVIGKDGLVPRDVEWCNAPRAMD